MNDSPIINNLPLILRYGAFLDVKTGSLNYMMVAIRVLTSLFSTVLAIWSIVVENNRELELFGKMQDLLCFILVLSHELALQGGKQHLPELVSFLQEPCPTFRTHTPQWAAVQRYQSRLRIGSAAIIIFFIFCCFWIISPTWFFIDESNVLESDYFNPPLKWIFGAMQTQTSRIVAFSISFLVLLFLVMMFHAYYPVMIFGILKIQLKSKIFAIEMENLDCKSNAACERIIWFLVTTSRLPLCDRCLKISLDRGQCIASKDCCLSEMKRKILQNRIETCLAEIVEQHIDIIRYVGLLDRTFCFSIAAYLQFAILLPALALPNITSIKHLSGAEIFYGVTEILGTFNCILGFSYCGQIILNESDRVWLSLHTYEWYTQDPRVRRHLLTMQTMATRSLRLTVAGVYPLNLETCRSIMESIYHYISVLQSLKE